MSSLKQRFISGLLTFVIVLTLIPITNMVNPIDVEAASNQVITDSNIYVSAAGQTGSKEGKNLILSAVSGDFSIEMWHYSGGYWGGTLSRKVYDSEFKQTEGGVANLEDSATAGGLIVGTQDFDFPIARGSELEKSIKNGDDIYVEISPASTNTDVTLDKLFNFPTIMNEKGNMVFKTDSNGSLIGYDSNGNETSQVARIEKLAKPTDYNEYKIVFSLPLKLNYYTEKELNFRQMLNKEGKTYGLNKYIPIPRLGFGDIKFSMYPRGKGGVQNDGNMAAYMWLGPESGLDKNGNKIEVSRYMSEPLAYIDELELGKIHPSMIMRKNNPSSGSSGYLYSGYGLTLHGKNPDPNKLYETGNYRIGLDTFANAGAVGIKFSYKLTMNIYSKPKQKAIGVYVLYKGNDENGNPIYEQLDSRDISENVEELPDGSLFVKDSDVVNINDKYYMADLNDVVVSAVDLGEPTDIMWEKTELPKNKAGKSVDDIDEKYLGDIEVIKERLINSIDEFGSVIYDDPFVLYVNQMMEQYYDWNIKEALEFVDMFEMQYPDINYDLFAGFLNNIKNLNPKKYIELQNTTTELVLRVREELKKYDNPNIQKMTKIQGIKSGYRNLIDKETDVATKKEYENLLDNTELAAFYNPKYAESKGYSVMGVVIAAVAVEAAVGQGAIGGVLDIIENKVLNDKKSGNMITEDVYVAENYFADGDETPSVTMEATNIELEPIVYARYILYPRTMQLNKIHIIEDDIEIDSYIEETVSIVLNDDGISTTVQFNDLTEELLETGDIVKFNNWVVSSEVVEDLKHNSIPSNGSQSGTTIPQTIENVLKTENVYADWSVIRYTDDEEESGGGSSSSKKVKVTLPQWKLSQYQSDLTNYTGNPGNWRTALSWLNLTPDRGHAGTSLTPTGRYNYYSVNPNEQIVGNTPENYKLYSWLHSKALTRGSYNISHDSNLKAVEMSGTLNLIKSTEDSGLSVAKWISENNNSFNELLKYDIRNAVKPNSVFNQSTYQKDREILDYGIQNVDTYTHAYSIKYHWWCHHRYYSHEVCDCYLGYENPIPSYVDAKYSLYATFNRYIQQNTDNRLLSINPDIKSNNGLTTLKYQDSDVLNVYPEYGMLFDNDNGDSSIKWMVGDQARKIQPVVYQTMEHKVYAKPTSTGNMATDNRARTSLNKVVQGDNTANGKQVLYKGGPVNTTFQMYRDSGADKKGILTVKTFALDIKTNSNGVNVKNEWGNSGYDSKQSHTSLLNAIDNTGRANVSEKLLVDSAVGNSYDRVVDYTGAIKSLTSDKYTKVKYGSSTKGTLLDGGNTVMFEHELVVRGGQVIGVYLMNRSSGNKTITSISDLKNRDVALYNALLNMNLYNEGNDKSQTVLSTFEHKTGNTLTESSYASMLQEARKVIDNNLVTPDNAKVFENEGWYSEDTTVLVVKEYVTNYEVPSISLSDKLSMSVKGLDTPIDKNQFFSVLGKGYTYLKYDLPLTVSNPKGGNFNTNSYFETTSLPNDGLDSFGYQGVDYLVPNVSISDTTRMN